MIVVIVLGIYWISRRAKALTPTEYAVSYGYSTIEEMRAVLARARDAYITTNYTGNRIYEEIAYSHGYEVVDDAQESVNSESESCDDCEEADDIAGAAEGTMILLYINQQQCLFKGTRLGGPFE